MESNRKEKPLMAFRVQGFYIPRANKIRGCWVWERNGLEGVWTENNIQGFVSGKRRYRGRGIACCYCRHCWFCGGYQLNFCYRMCLSFAYLFAIISATYLFIYVCCLPKNIIFILFLKKCLSTHSLNDLIHNFSTTM